MKDAISNIELERQRLQNLLDRSRNKLERNKLGQFATPYNLAFEIIKCTNELLNLRDKISFLDPALGTGSFYSAFLQVIDNERIDTSFGVEIDKEFASVAESLWSSTGLKVINDDFTKLTDNKIIKKVDLLICNPPYVRHHHLSEMDKTRYVQLVKSTFGISVSKLAGLYCHFIFLSHRFIKDNGISVWLVPSEFLDVNYGAAVKEYLLNYVELIRIHRFNPEDVKFADALVTSVVIWFKNRKPITDSMVEFTAGNSILKPSNTIQIERKNLISKEKWSCIFNNGHTVSNNSNAPKIKDLFYIKRGIATGNNDYFILSEDEIEKKGLPKFFFKPILPSPKFIGSDIIQSDIDGNPLIFERHFVLDCNLSKDKIDKKFQKLIDYINYGETKGVSLGYICKNRNPWYSQERRESPLFVCNYIGRENSTKAFRFILNKSKSIVTNSYLGLYPKPAFFKFQKSDPKISIQILEMLNSIESNDVIKNGRVYGGGMYKLEPKELENVELNLPANFIEYNKPTTQLTLFEPEKSYIAKDEIDSTKY